MMPMRANIVGPPDVATRISASIIGFENARRAQQTLRRDLQDCFRSIPSLKNSIWGNRQELPRHVPSVTEKEGCCNVRFCSHSGLKSDIAPCPKSAIFGLLHRSKHHPYSINSSASSCIELGTETPSCSALLMLLT